MLTGTCLFLLVLAGACGGVPGVDFEGSDHPPSLFEGPPSPQAEIDLDLEL
jgi:hypothetical protein